MSTPFDDLRDAPEPDGRFVFPVEVEVVGEFGDEHARQLAHYVFDRLDRTLRSRG